MSAIVVLATASRKSGALTIYRQFINHLSKFIANNSYYIFIHPVMPAPNIPGVTYIQVDTTSYLERILFDWCKCSKIIEKIGFTPDLVISLQNTGLRCFKNIPQIIYYHQPMPFYSYKWNPLRADERLLFYYKTIYPFFVKASINKLSSFVVQIPFMQKGLEHKWGIPKENIDVLFPDIENIDPIKIKGFNYDKSFRHYIYPATPLIYKRHKMIVRAVKILSERCPEVHNYLKIHFTLAPSDDIRLYKMVEDYSLNDIIKFDGTVQHDELLSMYKSSAGLLFPSIMETLGLPLLEAAAFGIPILVSDLEYAHDVLAGYDNVTFLDKNNEEAWAMEILNLLKSDLVYKPLNRNDISSWGEFFNLVNKKINL